MLILDFQSFFCGDNLFCSQVRGMWLDSLVAKASDWWLSGREFESRPPCCRVTSWANCSHLCSSVTKQYNLVLANGWWCASTWNVTGNGGWLKVTCGLTACTLGSAQSLHVVGDWMVSWVETCVSAASGKWSLKTEVSTYAANKSLWAGWTYYRVSGSVLLCLSVAAIWLCINDLMVSLFCHSLVCIMCVLCGKIIININTEYTLSKVQ